MLWTKLNFLNCFSKRIRTVFGCLVIGAITVFLLILNNGSTGVILIVMPTWYILHKLICGQQIAVRLKGSFILSAKIRDALASWTSANASKCHFRLWHFGFIVSGVKVRKSRYHLKWFSTALFDFMGSTSLQIAFVAS